MKGNAFSVRLEDEMRKAVEVKAKKHRRSITSEIEYLLELGLEMADREEALFEKFKEQTFNEHFTQK